MKPLALSLIRLAGRGWCRLHGADVSPRALIHGFPRISLKSGAVIRLDNGATLNCSLWSNPLNDGRRTVLAAGPGARIRFHAHAGASSSRIIAFREIVVAEGSLIGAGCLICDSDMHEVPLGSTSPVVALPIHIGRNVFVGAGSTILKGVTIGDGAVIGAHSLVCRDIPANCLAAGNPAVVIRENIKPPHSSEPRSRT